jgi:hypothetical protein
MLELESASDEEARVRAIIYRLSGHGVGGIVTANGDYWFVESE